MALETVTVLGYLFFVIIMTPMGVIVGTDNINYETLAMCNDLGDEKVDKIVFEYAVKGIPADVKGLCYCEDEVPKELQDAIKGKDNA
jgi:hypothetical protein